MDNARSPVGDLAAAMGRSIQFLKHINIQAAAAARLCLTLACLQVRTIHDASAAGVRLQAACAAGNGRKRSAALSDLELTHFYPSREIGAGRKMQVQVLCLYRPVYFNRCA